jgi:hypothetical protein
MVEGMVCPAREKPILAFSEHQNPLIHAPSIGIECLQPIDGVLGSSISQRIGGADGQN